MNPTQIMAFNEIAQWIKYKGFTQEDLAQILCAVDKECLKARGVTISELISKGAKMILTNSNDENKEVQMDDNKVVFNLLDIYKHLELWRKEKQIVLEDEKAKYIVNVMREFGKLSQALRDYEKIKNGERALRAGIFDIKSTLGEMTIFEGTTKGELEISLEKVEHEIIDALCNISVLTINAGTDIPCSEKLESINTTQTTRCNSSLSFLLSECGNFDYYGKLSSYVCFNQILLTCAKLCENYGFDFQIAMDETIKELSSRTGAYDEKAKKWVKDTSVEAKAKWYQANYELARIKKEETKV